MVGSDAVVGFEITDEESEGDEENDGKNAFDALGFHKV